MKPMTIGTTQGRRRFMDKCDGERVSVSTSPSYPFHSGIYLMWPFSFPISPFTF